MQIHSVTLSAPSRIHFGLLPASHEYPDTFGGCGIMVEEPRTVVRITRSVRLSIRGSQRERIAIAVEKWFEHFGRLSLSGSQYVDWGEIPVEIETLESPPSHIGFGSGTQLAMAVATALFAAMDIPPASPASIATALSRGTRTMIGTRGFGDGGFVADWGQTGPTTGDRLFEQLEFPTDWPVVLITPKVPGGLHGVAEVNAFEAGTAVSREQRQSMQQLLARRLLPSIRKRSYIEFAPALYEFGLASGSLFHRSQHHNFHSVEVTEIVGFVRSLGVSAVVQSSWGPTVAAFVERAQIADTLCHQLRERFPDDTMVIVTRADNRGAIMELDRGDGTELQFHKSIHNS
jgi:beta-RFAP synthase